MVESKETPKLVNPYAWLAPIKCLKCNQSGHRSSDYLLKKVIHLVEREEENDKKVCCEPDGYGDDDEVYKDDDEGQNYVVKKLMLLPKQ